MTGLVFFAAALLYFVYNYTIVFSREVSGGVSTRAIVFDVGLFTVFALHHSVFARDGIRNAVTRLVGTLERSAYVWLASALFVAICAGWRPIAGAAWRTDEPVVVWILRAGQAAGVWFTLRSAAMIDIGHLSGVAQVSDGTPAEGRAAQPIEFKTHGPYGWVRHPIYTGWFLLVFSVPVMTMTRLVFAVSSSLYLLIAIPLEERSLRQSSAGSYDAYMRKVRWKLLPHVF